VNKRNRDINIFNVSALDLFANGMGVFILITLTLFPYFGNTGDSPERVSEVREQMAQQLADARAAAAAAQAALDQTRTDSQAASGQLQTALGRVADLEARLAACEARPVANPTETQQLLQQIQQCRAALEVTFAVVVISWGTSEDDVDLHITDPRGNEYYYGARNFAGSDAVFEEDSIRGPGNEIWQSLAAIPGQYRIEVVMYSKNATEAAEVRGFVLHQNGRNALRTTRLTRTDQRETVATFVVDDEGNVTLR
jgi:hypothetical protein